MKTNPIIPIWLMIIICIILLFLLIYNKSFWKKISKKEESIRTTRQKKILKSYILDVSLKILIIILLFCINIRPMIPNGESIAQTTNIDVLFVIDTSVSMSALDYNEKNERMTGIKNDCTYIIDELGGSKFSVITFGETAQKVIPFTMDSDMVATEIKAIKVENSYYANGTSINIVKDVFEKTLKEEFEKEKESKIIVFFISDGEITVERRKSFFFF